MVYKRRIILPAQQADCVYIQKEIAVDCVYRQKEIAGAGQSFDLICVYWFSYRNCYKPVPAGLRGGVKMIRKSYKIIRKRMYMYAPTRLAYGVGV